MRLFVAIELDENVRAALSRSQHALKPLCPDVRWVAPPLLHLTIQFLGDVPDQQVPAVTEAVTRAAAEAESFTMQVARSGCFPPRGPVRIVWVGAGDSSGRLEHCVQRIGEELFEVGYPPEDRPFSAHITVGRVKDDRSGGALRRAVEKHSFDEREQSVTSITLMSSVLDRQGPTYAPIHHAGLGGQGR